MNNACRIKKLSSRRNGEQQKNWMRDEEHENEDIGTALESTGFRLEGSHFLQYVVDVALVIEK